MPRHNLLHVSKSSANEMQVATFCGLPVSHAMCASKVTRDGRSAPEAVAQRLREFRESLGKNQAQLCRETGFSTAQWAQYETAANGRRISLEGALTLNKHYGVTLDFIFLGDRSGLPVRIAEKLPTAASTQPVGERSIKH